MKKSYDSFTSKYYIISLVAIILSLALIMFSAYIWESHSSWASFILNLGSTILIGSSLSVIFKYLQDKIDNKILRELFKIHESIDIAGLENIEENSSKYSFENILRNSKELSIVINDGNSWVKNPENLEALKYRFSIDSELHFFVVDPDSDFARALAKKVQMDHSELQKKINSTFEMLESTYKDSPKKGKLFIYKLKNYPTRTIYLSETHLIETPYQIASGRVIVPAYIYKKNGKEYSPYSFAYRDVEILKKDSIRCFDGENK